MYTRPMGRADLLDLVREISRIVFLDGGPDESSSEEKMIRVKHLLIDSFTENAVSVPTFDSSVDTKKNK